MMLKLDWWMLPTLLTLLSLLWLFMPMRNMPRGELGAARVAISVLVAICLNLVAWLVWAICN